MMRKFTRGGAILSTPLALAACAGSEGGASSDLGAEPTTFSITVENVSGEADVPSPVAPGVWVVHQDGRPLFSEGEPDRGEGLEALAEDGDPEELNASLDASGYDFGSFAQVGQTYDTGARMPGESFVFSITAQPGDRLSIASMIVETNDQFLAFSDEGVALFDEEGMPVSGVLSARVWDAGTEVNQPLGEGADQPLRQLEHDTGEAEGGQVVESTLAADAFVQITIVALGED